jgi:hypothetical protein
LEAGGDYAQGSAFEGARSPIWLARDLGQGRTGKPTRLSNGPTLNSDAGDFSAWQRAMIAQWRNFHYAEKW